jgi:hypothetical protein
MRADKPGAAGNQHFHFLFLLYRYATACAPGAPVWEFTIAGANRQLALCELSRTPDSVVDTPTDRQNGYRRLPGFLLSSGQLPFVRHNRPQISSLSICAVSNCYI